MTTIQRPIHKYYKNYILKGNSLVIKSDCGMHYLSLPNEVGRTGTLYIDTGIWFATNLNLPKDTTVKWEITDEYILFYKIEDKKIISTQSVKLN